MDIMDKLRTETLRSDLPEFGIGDTVAVAVRIQEGAKSRLQNFEGAVIAQQGHGSERSMTVRRLSGGIAVERVFAMESPNLASIRVVKRGRIRRSKLYYLRGKTGRQGRIREARRK